MKAMEAWLIELAHYVGLVIEAMALVIIVYGSIEAFAAGVRLVFSSGATNQERRAIWLRYARWLVAGLTFQLAADVVHTSIAPTWDDIGRLGAIALIRTVLSYFLERDVDEVGERQRMRAEAPSGGSS